MKTTLDLPDDLMREVRIRAAREGRKLKDLLADTIRAGLAVPMAVPGGVANRPLPLIKAAKAPGRIRPMSIAEACEFVKSAELRIDPE